MKQFTLSKTERLYLRNAVSELFAKGSSFMVFPYRIVYRLLPEDDSQEARVAIMTIAPKKRFKHAVDRNRVKRLSREAYRLAKLPLVELCTEKHCKLAFAMLYSDNKFLTFAETQSRMAKIIRNLSQKIREKDV
ncbi:MAG: ribonuclease P protein component [Bacteroidales bacterium]|nr:ribonuclease P protein component [Bacteroidales bacterium]